MSEDIGDFKTRRTSPIEKVPEDVLALFAHYSFANSGVNSSIILSHVSAAFRRAVLDQALFWTVLSSSFPIDKVKAFIDRSKNVGLQVQIYIREQVHYSSEEIHAFLDTVLLCSARWEGFSIFTPPYARKHELASAEVLHIVQKRCSGMDLPRLEGLYVQNNWKSLWEGSGAAVHNTWKSAPLLRQLHAINLVIRPSSITNNITSLKLQYSEKRSPLSRDVLAFLATTPLLQELSIVVHVLEVELHGGPLPQISLPHLEHLLLRLTTSDIESPLLSLIGVLVLMRSISTPNLRSHSSSYEFPSHSLHSIDEYNKIINDLIPGPTGHLLLNSINLAIFISPVEYPWARGWNDMPRLEFPLRKIPQVERFAFASVLPFGFNSEADRRIRVKAFAPHLKHLTLTCPKLRGGDLFELVDHLEAVGMMDTLEGIDFVGCNVLTPREIFKIVDAKEKRVLIST